MAHTKALKQKATGLVVRRELTEKQKRFVTAIVSKGVNPTVGAREAGYETPRSDGFRLIRLPHVQDAIRQERGALFSGDLAQVATQTLREIMVDSEAPASARVQAVRVVLEVSGELRTGKSKGESNAPGELHELSPQDLGKLIATWENERASLAQDIGQGHVQINQAGANAPKLAPTDNKSH